MESAQQQQTRKLRDKAELLYKFHKAVITREQPDGNDWTALIHVVDTQWDNRGTSLVVSPLGLTNKEIRLCLLLYFQFSYKLQARRQELDQEDQALVDAWLQKLILKQKPLYSGKFPPHG